MFCAGRGRGHWSARAGGGVRQHRWAERGGEDDDFEDARRTLASLFGGGGSAEGAAGRVYAADAGAGLVHADDGAGFFAAASGAGGGREGFGGVRAVFGDFDAAVAGAFGGELRRLFLARLLADRRIDLLALDEPTQGMDVRGESEFYGVVENFLGDNPGAGALIVSHDLERVMMRSDRVYCVDGTIRCHGAGDDVIRDPALAEVFRGHIGLYRHHHQHCAEARGE